MSTILLLGGQGQLGWELRRAVMPLGSVEAPDRAALDLSDEIAVEEALVGLKPAMILNAAAYTQVDAAESHREAAKRLNAQLPEQLAQWAAKQGVPLVHFSTDYVFDGTQDERPYRETDATAPLNSYGETKRSGELSIEAAAPPYLILRTSWVYSARRSNFLRTMCRLAREREELSVVSDQYGAPTWARALAEISIQMVLQLGPDADAWHTRGGLYHVSAAGQTNWFGFTKAIMGHLAAQEPSRPLPELTAIRTADYPTAAKRPAYSLLDNSHLVETFGLSLPDWKEQLALCMADMAV